VEPEILDLFLEAVRQVFLESEIPIESIAVEETPRDGGDQVITSVGLIGEVRGVLMLRTDAPGADGIVRAMTGGMRLNLQDESISELQMAALGELANQISGRATTLLSRRGVHCDITPPAVVAALHLRSLVPHLGGAVTWTIRGPFGRLTVFLGMERRHAANG